MNKVFETKSVLTNEISLKDIDETNGIITGYFSIFGNIDSDDDMIMPGAFKKSLQENYRRQKHLYQHNSWQILAGTNQERLVLKEDKIGLYFESKISQTSYGKDVLQLYKDGCIDEHSIGFRVVKSNDKDKYKELTELQLWEGSSVTWGANELAQSTGIKSMTPEMVCKKMDNVLKAIRHGKYENEELFDLLEIYHKQLQQLFIDLTKEKTTEPEQASTTQPGEKQVDSTTDLFTFKKQTA